MSGRRAQRLLTIGICILVIQAQISKCPAMLKAHREAVLSVVGHREDGGWTEAGRTSWGAKMPQGHHGEMGHLR